MARARWWDRAFPYALVASALLHALVFCFPGPKRTAPPPARLQLVLRPLPERVLAPPSIAPAAPPPLREHAAAPRPRPAASPALATSNDSPSPLAGAKPALDMETIRQQAREVAQGLSVAPANRAADAGARKNAVAGALERAVGQLPVVSEATLADGTRFVRFKGNTCLRVPAHVPFWRDSGVVPVEWMVTNC